MAFLDRFRIRKAPVPVAELSNLRALPPKRSTEPTVTVTPTPDKRPFTGKRVFQAAASGRLEQSWVSTPSTMDAWIYQHWGTLVARAREQAQNNDHATKYVQLCRDNVAGPHGFTLQAQVKDPNGSPDTLASEAIEAAFKEFSKRKNFCVDKSTSRKEMERLIVNEYATVGEFIAVARYGKNLNKFGFAVQVIDPVLLDPKHYQDLGNGNTIRHGIEFDSNGAPVRYFFRKMDERQLGYVTSMGNDYDVVPAENVCHIFFKESVGQKRGLPPMRTALWRMRMLSGFEDAAVVNARVGAAKMGFFRDPEGDAADMEDIPMEGDPGTFEDIGNRELVQWNPQFPDQSIEPFTKSLLRSIASGLKCSYNNLASDLTSVNFSSIRQGALDEREVWKGLQEMFIEQWCEWLYEKWLQRALLAQAITVANKPLRYDRIAKYMQVAWRPRRWGWIDPSAEMAANEKAIAMRIKSRSEVIGETTGRDSSDVWAEINRDDQDMAKLGVVPEPMAGSPAPNNSNNNSSTQET